MAEDETAPAEEGAVDAGETLEARVSAEARDLPQARLAIEALRALEPVLREGGVEEGLVRDLEQARVNLQLAYAKAVSEETPQDASG